MERKLEIKIADSKLEINLTNIDVGQALTLLETGVRVLTNRELLRMGCKATGARVHQNASSREPETIHHEFPNDPIAKTMADLITPKQLIAIRAICNAAGLNAEEECLTHPPLKCRPEELNRTAASAFINHLRQKAADAEQARGEQLYRHIG